MIIIADSGSTKTDWRLLDSSHRIKSRQSIGLNPHLVSTLTFHTALEEAGLADWQDLPISRLYFYSAGITDRKTQGEAISRLKTWFGKTDITVASDLLGAARAAYGHSEGIIGILGTGSNSGYYNGHEISQSIAALGYLLGDEGSGNALGKQLATAYLRHRLPQELTAEFESFCPDHQQLLSNIYADNQPGRLLASLVPFLYQHQDNAYIAGLLRDEFARYFELIKGYNDNKVALIGSIAHYFHNLILEVAAVFGIQVTRVIKSPVDELVKFHLQEL